MNCSIASAVELTVTQRKYMHFIEDGITQEQIVGDQTLAWRDLPLYLAPSTSAWIRVKFEAKGVQPSESLVLTLTERAPLATRFYLFNGQGVLLSESGAGARIPLSQWQNRDFNGSHNFNLPRDGFYVFLIKVETEIYSIFRFELRTQSEHLAIERASNLQAFLILGGLFAILLYNILLWVSLQRRVFLHFAILNGLYVLFTASVEGILGAVVARYCPGISPVLTVLPFVCVSEFLRFSTLYLNLTKNSSSRRMIVDASRMLLLAGSIALIAPIIAQLIGFLSLFYGLLGLCRLGLPLGSFRVDKMRADVALLFVGTLPILVVWSILVPYLGDAFDVPLQDFVPFALIFQILCLGAGLANRITEVRKSFDVSIELRTEELESQVRERTATLESANLKLAKEVEERRLIEERSFVQSAYLAETQERLISASRLSALGDMATGISHEINNPLTVLKGYLYLLKDSIGGPALSIDKQKQMIEKGILVADRMANVIQKMRAFSLQEQNLVPIDVSLTENWNLTLNLCHQKVSSFGVQLIVDEWDNQLSVRVKPADLTQVILSCLNNAAEAVNALDDRWIRVSVLFDEVYVTIRIVDSGAGLSDEFAEKIFAPFFTTKGQGAGVGLSVARQLMRGSGGDVRFVSGQTNTTFEIMILRGLGGESEVTSTAAAS
ncbi:MAG: ATP-binding protein [Proteobacteria bacterium]|nr:ATP-binding protein [Pseudomonadota bacterium]